MRTLVYAFSGALLWASSALTVTATDEKVAHRVMFVAGPASHGPGEHEHPAGCELLAEALNGSGVALHASVSLGWPDTAAFAEADTLVLYSDGLEDHVASGRLEALRRHVEAGRGLVVLHFALEPAPGELADFLLDTLGGIFEEGWSVNPVWKMEAPLLADHSVTSGVEPFSLEEEFYYHLRFLDTAQPVLRAVPPVDSVGDDGPRTGNPAVRNAIANRVPQVLAWVHEHGGTRAFGYTGGHFHRNWTHDGIRKLVLNAIVWTAGLPVPEKGVASEVAPVPRYTSIEESIARGDLEDVKLHIAAYPERLHKGKHPKLSPLQQAILRKKREIALFLLEAGAEPNQVDASSRTLLHLTVDRDDAVVTAALLEKGADPDTLDKDGWTPLHHAAARDRVEVAQALLAGGADVMTLSARGGTPLHEAAASGSAAMVELILENGVDHTVVSQTGVTALDIAREYKNEAAIEVLEAL